METLIPVLFIVVLLVIVIARTATVVPQQSAYVVERLGKYSKTLQADSTSSFRSSSASRIGTRSRRPPSTSPSRSASRATNVQVHVDACST